MIDSDLQQQLGQQVAGEQIAVPESQGAVTFASDGGMPDIETLKKIRDEVGEQALTDEEYTLLQMHEQQSLPHARPADHYANLAEYVDEAALSRIGQDVLNWVQWDEDSRADWYAREKKGIEALGITDANGITPAFEGGSTVTHPLIAEAIVQFQARALGQVWPAGGPVKTAVLGKATEEREQQAQRVEQFMNYQYTEEIPGAFEQTDKMLVRLPLSGSCFIKPYYDPIDGLSRIFIDPADFIVPYKATSLRTVQRYTERIFKSENDVKKLQAIGHFRNVSLVQPFEDSSDSSRDVVQDAVDKTEGRTDPNRSTEDQRRTLYECVCELDLQGFEDAGADGKLTGIALQYVVTVDKDSQKVLAIYRNWRPTDPRRRRIVGVAHYRFMQGLGFYGFGLYHWIGGLSRAATGALRALLDSAQFANMSGGFRAKDAGMPKGDLHVKPGEWKEVDVEGADLSKAFFNLPYKEPSTVLLNLLGALQELGRRFAGTTEVMVGEGNQNVPVGTILARIEQGGQVQTGVQMRLHQAQAEEFEIVAYLNSIYLPEEYPYAVQGDDRRVLRQDFDDRIDIKPVSDPNTVSNMQRYFMSEALLGLAQKFPGYFDTYQILRRAATALRVDDIDAVLPRPDHGKRYDPVTENALVGVGRSVKAFQDQAHDAHIAVHAQAMQALPQNNPTVPALQAHIQQHMAMAYLQQMAQAAGIPFELPDEDAPELPPEVEMQVSIAAAQAAQQLQSPPPPDPEQVKIESEQQRRDALTHAHIAREDAKADADIRRKDQTAAADIHRDNVTETAGLMQKAAQPQYT